jgi:hypothetical protein
MRLCALRVLVLLCFLPPAASLADQVTELDFRWESMRVSNRTDGSHWTMSIPEGTQDKLGLQLALMMDLARGRRFNTYPVADGGRLKQYRFRMTGKQTIQTIFGPLKTLRVSRSKQNKAPDAVFWFAPDLNYTPVRIDRERKNTRFRMELDRLEGLTFSKDR